MLTEDSQLKTFLSAPFALSDAAESASAKHGLTPWLCQQHFLVHLNAAQQQRIRSAFARERLHDAQQAMHLKILAYAFEANALPALVIKGAALARQIYPQLGLRAKGDLDVWVPYSCLTKVRNLLAELGYRAIPCNFGRFSQPEQSFVGPNWQNPVKIDLHWEVSARPLLARAFTFDSIWAASVDFGFGSKVRAPNILDALLIAIVHRVGHHREDARWIWLKDIDLIWRGLSTSQKRLTYETAKARGVLALLHEGLTSTAAIFGTPLDFDAAEIDAPAELSALLLDPNSSLLWIDFRSMKLLDFIKLCSEHAFPPNEFMQHRFGAHPSWLRGWYYAKRWLHSIRS